MTQWPVYAHISGPIPDPTLLDPRIPKSCAKVIHRAMAKAPADRYQSAEEMMADVTAILGTLNGHKAVALPSEISEGIDFVPGFECGSSIA